MKVTQIEEMVDSGIEIANVYVPATEDCHPLISNYPEPDSLSDLDTSTDGFPMVEWDTFYGRYWVRYANEAERQEALNSNQKEWVIYEAIMTEKPYEWLKKYIN